MSRRIPLAAAAGWLITAAIATGAGVTVIGVLGEPLADSAGRPLSAREVREALARATPAADVTAAGSAPSADPTAAGPASTTVTEAPADAPAEDPAAPTAAGPSATPTAVSTAVSATPMTPVTPAPTAAGPPPGRSRLIATAGGNVIARCDGGMVTLRSWSPAQGFHVDKVDRGPDRRARVEFESESGEVKVEVRCSASGTPVHTLDD
ncbi:hypothetical protein [Streptosporangium pseudovulgare]|uniref:Septum formation initiator n=1 Tax=Streptosporangium pseudovulgare TaxID=35765 RepID=A0ABQ2QGX6_9ACTN|nr:hypothetical protein [Streptosporangium pseudovulgare]GGP80226.1 hypothetical protein GCM10010140_06110 [Streptosporangium pseudovulgare]